LTVNATRLAIRLMVAGDVNGHPGSPSAGSGKEKAEPEALPLFYETLQMMVSRPRRQ